MTDDNRPEWFAPRRFGIGAGLPIAWQGWALLAGYLALMLAATALLASRQPDQHLAAIALMILATTAFVTVAARTTRGGWRWRWGSGRD
jgi:hypothetical protein